MSEYIVVGAEPNNTVLKSITKNGYEHEKWLPVCEEIVRCRDCKFFKCETDIFPALCRLWLPRNLSKQYGIEPNGFCAWGERRGDAE